MIINERRAAELPVEDAYLTIKSDGKLFRIKQKDVLYFHSLSNYYKVVTAEKKLIAYGSLSALESELPEGSFIRIHRSYLVAKNKIQAYSGNDVVVNGELLPIGRAYRGFLEEFFLQNILLLQKK